MKKKNIKNASKSKYREGKFEVCVTDNDFSMVYHNKVPLRVKDLSVVFEDLRKRGVPIDKAIKRSIQIVPDDWY